MNADQRKVLSKQIGLVETVKDVVESMKDEEQEKFDNLPEGLQQAESGQKLETIVSCLNDAYDALDNAVSALGEAEGA